MKIISFLHGDKPLRDPEGAASVATVHTLLLQTVPFVNGEWVEKFIAANEAHAEECGKLSGVFA